MKSASLRATYYKQCKRSHLHKWMAPATNVIQPLGPFHLLKGIDYVMAREILRAPPMDIVTEIQPPFDSRK